MAQVSLFPSRMDIPRSGTAHDMAALTGAQLLVILNRAPTNPQLGAGGPQLQAGLSPYLLSGEWWNAPTNPVNWTLVGPPLAPGLTNVYIALFEPAAGTTPASSGATAAVIPTVVAGTPAPTVAGVSFASALASNGYEATVALLNAPPNGRVMAGGVIVQNNSAAPFIPGTTALDTPPTGVTARIFNGFYGPLLANVVSGAITGPAVAATAGELSAITPEFEQVES